MATLLELCQRQELEQLGGGLEDDEQPERLLYAFPHVVRWLDEILPHVASDLGDGRQSPIEQFDDLAHEFVSGGDLAYYERSHSMEPHGMGVWELKTPDLRIFGWFRSRGVFVIANINTAYECKLHSLYAGYRNDTVRRRNRVNLDDPKFLVGEYEDVL